MADVGDQYPSSDSPTTPFRKVVLPAEETVRIPRPSPQRPYLPPPPPPKRGPLSRVGDIPIKVVYLLAAIVATVVAVLLIFVIFSGDVPKQPPQPKVVPVTPALSATPTPKATTGAIVLPATPAKQALPRLPGKASATIGTITDRTTGIRYPRLGKPWKARSYPPFSVAQRVGKVAVPHTVIASAMLPGDEPLAKPKKVADYREIAVRGVRWTLLTQYPKGATLAWTGSRNLPLGKGWTLGYKVTYPVGSGRRTSQALLSVIEVGKTKPAMLLASIPESGKAHWRDLNTIAKAVRPL
ncbi:hypothetical protein ABZ297_15010 [Nonomuraea sp. NPDC005983]|uniref:hypothetical protein n=1 Tax=Nonomuraea sp. NPDC005983 TaxID=3155595 RepID=UPI0033AB61D6